MRGRREVVCVWEGGLSDHPLIVFMIAHPTLGARARVGCEQGCVCTILTCHSLLLVITWYSIIGPPGLISLIARQLSATQLFIHDVSLEIN